MGSRFSGTESEKIAQEYMNNVLEKNAIPVDNYEFE